MDPFARKMILGAVAFGIIMAAMAGALTVVYFHQRPRCSEQVLAESPGPDRKSTAAVLQRRCGDDSPFFVHVNIRSISAPIRMGFFSGEVTEGEVFVAEQETPDLMPEVLWTAPAAITIRCPRCRVATVRRGDDHIGAIAIRYELGP